MKFMSGGTFYFYIQNIKKLTSGSEKYAAKLNIDYGVTNISPVSPNSKSGQPGINLKKAM